MRHVVALILISCAGCTSQVEKEAKAATKQAVVKGAAALPAAEPQDEPTYKGKPISSVLKRLADLDEGTSVRAAEDLRYMGEAGHSTIMKAMHDSELRWKMLPGLSQEFIEANKKELLPIVQDMKKDKRRAGKVERVEDIVTGEWFRRNFAAMAKQAADPLGVDRRIAMAWLATDGGEKGEALVVGYLKNPDAKAYAIQAITRPFAQKHRATVEAALREFAVDNPEDAAQRAANWGVTLRK